MLNPKSAVRKNTKQHKLYHRRPPEIKKLSNG